MSLENIEYSDRNRDTVFNAESNPNKKADGKVMITPTTRGRLAKWFLSRKNRNSRIDYKVEKINDKKDAYNDEIAKYEDKIEKSSTDTMRQVYELRIKKLSSEINYLDNRIKRIESKRKPKPIKLKSRALSMLVGAWDYIKRLPGLRKLTNWAYNRGIDDIQNDEEQISREVDEAFSNIGVNENENNNVEVNSNDAVDMSSIEKEISQNVGEVLSLPVNEDVVKEPEYNSENDVYMENKNAFGEDEFVQNMENVSGYSADNIVTEPVYNIVSDAYVDSEEHFEEDAVIDVDYVELPDENEHISVDDMLNRSIEEKEQISNGSDMTKDAAFNTNDTPIVVPERSNIGPVSSEYIRNSLSTKLDDYLKESSKDYVHEDFSYDEMIDSETVKKGLDRYDEKKEAERKEQERINALIDEKYSQIVPEGLKLSSEQETEIKEKLRVLVLREQEAAKKAEEESAEKQRVEEARKRNEAAKNNYVNDLMSKLGNDINDINSKVEEYDASIAASRELIEAQDNEINLMNQEVSMGRR